MGRTNKIDIVSDWNTPDPLRLTKKDQNSSYRWIRKSEIETRKQQGWEVVTRNEVGMETDPRVSRGESSTAQCNELILCKRPKEMNEAHRRYLDDKNKRIIDALGNQFHQEGKTSGFSTYGEVKVETNKSE